MLCKWAQGLPGDDPGLVAVLAVVLQPCPCSAAGCHQGMGLKEWDWGTCCPSSSLEELDDEEGLSGLRPLSCCLGA